MKMVQVMKNGLAMVLCVAIQASYVWGQDNQPPKPQSKAETEAAFNRILKLDQIRKGAIELELKGTLPSDKGIEEKQLFFRNPSHIAIDDRGHIYIPQGYPVGVIDELNEEGKLVRKYNKIGQGPGEIQSPSSVMFFNHQVIVCDNMTRRMIFFDRDWQYLKSLALQKPCYSFVLGSHGLFYGAEILGDKLISILDTEGKLMGSFGERPDPGRSQLHSPALNSLVLGVSPEGSIWAGFQALGLLRRYSTEGTLEREIDIVAISNKLMKSYFEENLKWAEKGIPKNHVILKDIAFTGADVFVLIGAGVVQPIYRFDNEGRLKASYFVKPRLGLNLLSLSVRVERNGEEKFYVWQLDPELDEPRIGVYGRRTGL